MAAFALVVLALADAGPNSTCGSAEGDADGGGSAGGRPAALVFVHLPKAGGTSMKELIQRHAAEYHMGPSVPLWRKTWPYLVKDCRSRLPTMCNRSLYMGTDSFGACDFVMRRPCRYFTMFRDPVARVQSHYHYLCVQGAEGRKGWQPGWKRCEVTLEEWAARIRLATVYQLSVPFVARRGAGRCNCSSAGCEEPAQEEALLAQAERNIRSGAVVPMLLDAPAASARVLLDRLQLKLRTDTLSHLNSHSVHNGTGASRRLVAMLRLEQSLYEFARREVLAPKRH